MHDALSGIDAQVLVNNAGVGTIKPFMELTREEWTQMVDVNFNALFDVTRAVLPAMIARQSRPRRRHRLDLRTQRVRRRHLLRRDEARGRWDSASRLMLELRDSGVKVSIVNPGSVATSFSARARRELDACRRTTLPTPSPT